MGRGFWPRARGEYRVFGRVRTPRLRLGFCGVVVPGVDEGGDAGVDGEVGGVGGFAAFDEGDDGADAGGVGAVEGDDDPADGLLVEVDGLEEEEFLGVEAGEADAGFDVADDFGEVHSSP